METRRFPRTLVAGVSLSRMIIGTNWLLGWSHTGAAADAAIREKFAKPEDFYPVFDYAFSISPGRTNLDESLKNGPADLHAFAWNLARLIRDGGRIAGGIVS